ncbi:MAG: hypothetical protein LBM94_04040 [Propionibacteriaceae bacterium]|jgi:hypothetical protein|nr:hypothetical protein [Propionibacteriaceae bacterium]
MSDDPFKDPSFDDTVGSESIPPTPAPAARRAALDLDETAAPETEAVVAAAQEEDKKRRSPLGIILSLLGVALVIAGIILAFLALRPAADPGYVDLDGTAVTPDDGTMNNAEWVEKANLEEITGATFRVPERGLIYPYGEVNEVDGVINPPNFKGVFRIRNRGVSLESRETGTVYLATHALRGGGRAPGNDLSDMERGSSSLVRGMEMIVNTVTYYFDSSYTVSNDDLGRYPDLFGVGEQIPGRVVILTCMQKPDWSAPTENLVIVGWLPGYEPLAANPAPDPEPTPTTTP